MIGKELTGIGIDFLDLKFERLDNRVRVLDFERNPCRDSFRGFILRSVESIEFLALALVLGKLKRIISQLNRIGPLGRSGSLLKLSNTLNKILLFG